MPGKGAKDCVVCSTFARLLAHAHNELAVFFFYARLLAARFYLYLNAQDAPGRRKIA